MTILLADRLVVLATRARASAEAETPTIPAEIRAEMVHLAREAIALPGAQHAEMRRIGVRIAAILLSIADAGKREPELLRSRARSLVTQAHAAWAAEVMPTTEMPAPPARLSAPVNVIFAAFGAAAGRSAVA